MLELSFYNVGDGDAILLREIRPGLPDLTVLVDTGRPFIELGEGSKRRDIVTHLMQDGITHIDWLILTHLHIDHIGGAANILRRFPVGTLCADYFPPADAGWVPLPEDTAVKTNVGLRYLLNIYQNLWQEFQQCGTMAVEATEGRTDLTENLSVRFLPAPPEERREQITVCSALYRGEQPGEDAVYRASKCRNPNGLVTVFTYAGRRIVLAADVYAEQLEKRLRAAYPETAAGSLACDILKLPHHGDEKAASAALLDLLSPRCCVISCQTDPPERKHRPAPETVALLAGRGLPFVCTENRPLPGLEGTTHRVIRFLIEEDGTVTPSFI